MHFDTIVVPRGLEARAVERGWPVRRPPLVLVPAGAASGSGLGAVPSASAVLVMGVCGALDPSLQVGDAVVYASVADGLQTFELDPEVAAACAAPLGTRPVIAAAVPRVVGDVDAKAALRAATGAAVIDMEAASIARALHGRGIRLAMVRVVSDDARRDLPDLGDIYDASGALRPAALASALLRRPGRSARFIVNVFESLRALRLTATRLASHVSLGVSARES